jgi:Glycosyl transferase family 2
VDNPIVRELFHTEAIDNKTPIQPTMNAARQRGVSSPTLGVRGACPPTTPGGGGGSRTGGGGIDLAGGDAGGWGSVLIAARIVSGCTSRGDAHGHLDRHPAHMSAGIGRGLTGAASRSVGTLAQVMTPAAGSSNETLTIFFPMWNEEAYIERTIGAAREVADELVEAGTISDYELIVVNDASTDHTGKLADEMAANDRHVRVVHHPVNRKLGGSIKSGFAAATGDLVLYTDADLPFDMAELHKAIRLLRYYQADIVSAYRFDRVGEGPSRAIYTFFYNIMIRRLFGVRMRDINFAFKLCRRTVFDHVTLRSEGSFIDAELIIRARKLGYDVIQFGVDYFPRTRGESTLSSLSVIKRIVVEMFTLRRELRDLTPVTRGLSSP